MSVFFFVSADEGLWDTFVRYLPPSSTSHTVSLERLRHGVSYQFRVLAVNEYGYGEPSAPSAAMSGKYTFLPHWLFTDQSSINRLFFIHFILC